MKPVIRISAGAERNLKELLEGKLTNAVPCLTLGRSPGGEAALVLDDVPQENEPAEFAGLVVVLLSPSVRSVLEEVSSDRPTERGGPGLSLIK